MSSLLFRIGPTVASCVIFYNVMVKKVCKVCGEEKDSENGFYKTSGLTCRECKKEKTAAAKIEAKQNAASLLSELLHEQQEIKSQMKAIEKEMAKLTKAMKKLSAG